MPFVPDRLEEHGDPDSDPEVIVRISVPEEFAGSAMGLLRYRGGVITGIDSQPGAAHALSQKPNVTIIRGPLPRSQYAALAEDIVEATLGRGKVEIQSPSDNPTQATRE